MKTLSFLLVLTMVALGCGGPPPAIDSGVLPETDAGAGVDAGPPVFTLAPGEVAELTVNADGIASAHLSTPTGTEKFIVVLASTKFDTLGQSSAYSLNQGLALGTGEGALVTGCSLSTSPWSTRPPPAETAPTGTAPDAGTTRTLIMQTAAGTETITVQAIATSASAVVWADITPAHPAQLDAGFVDQFLADFESTILPRERALFGVESDLDHDGHIGLVFTPLTYQTAVAFFTQCDLQPQAGCPAGNGGEYLYLTPPNTIAPPYNTPNAIKEIISHETSHLVHYNRKVLRNALTAWTDSAYLIEGVGAFGQDAVGPQAGNLYVAMAGLDGINQFSLSQVLIDDVAYDTTRDGILRGGSYWFVRYLYDRAGGDQLAADHTISGLGGPSFLRDVLDANTSVATRLPVATGSSLADIAVDFYTTLALSNRDQNGGVAPTNACFAYRPATIDPVWNRQRGANLYAHFSMTMKGPATQPASAVDGNVLGGGVEYITLDATSTPELLFTVQASPAAKVRVRVARLQ